MTRARVLIELQMLIAEYWASVDRVADGTRSAASFFTETGEMELGSLHVRGRESLVAFFAARNEREIANRRTTRHLFGNLRMHVDSAERATIAALVLVHSGCGDWPLASVPPSAVGDFTFRCLLDPVHGWLFEKVAGTTVFVGEGAPNFARNAN